MELRDWLTVIALIAGPSFAVWLTLFAQKRGQVRNQRLGVFQTLLAYRLDWYNPERVKALCLIDIVFHNVPSVRAKWKEYYDALADQQFNDGKNDAVKVWEKKQNIMLAEMGRVLGYGRDIGYEEITRGYAPKQYNINFLASQKAQTEILRLLENSENFGTPRR